MDRAAAWLVIYSGIVSLRMHPRNVAGLDVKHCAQVADLAMTEFDRRFPCHGSSVEPSSVVA